MSRADFAVRIPRGRAMRQVMEAADQETAPQAASPTRGGVTAPIVVGAADDHAERHADEVADRVLARLSVDAETHQDAPGHGQVQRSMAGSIGAEGGTLTTEAATDLASAEGTGAPLSPAVRRTMEAGFGHGLPADVRLHTDARAARLAAGMNAEAFTQGRDIFFSPGAYDPGSTAGQHLLAHELTHVVQQGSGTVQRKLGGTAAALRNQGTEGGKSTSSGRLRKATGKLTNWDALLKAVQDYEKAEAKALSGGLNKITAGPHKPKLLSRLASIQRYIAKWREANDDKQQTDAINAQAASTEGGVDQDTRTKASRRQAIAMLVPRVNDEARMLGRDDLSEWLRSAGAGGVTVTGTGGDTQRGVVNEVHEVATQRLAGEEAGFFKAEHGITAKGTYQAHEQDTGIRQIDPNAGARSLALYRLDQLFGAGVTAKVEFAVYDAGGGARMGTFMEKAKGKAASKTTWAHDKQGARETGKGAVALDDPALQRGLNVLQLLDAIAGQLDRHSGNYFVDTDAQGNVTQVTGIDLDMAFGDKMTTTGREGAKYAGTGKARKQVKAADAAMQAHNYRGLPEYIDEAFGLRLLQVRPADIRSALTGLLTDAEITATLARFAEVQAAVQQAKDAGTLVKKWDGQTSKRDRIASNDLVYGSSQKTYRDSLENDLKNQRAPLIVAKFRQMLRHPILARVAPALAASPALMELVEGVFMHDGGSLVIKSISVWANDHQVSPAEENRLVLELAKEAFSDARMAPLAGQLAEGTTVPNNTIASVINAGTKQALVQFGQQLDAARKKQGR
jgi:hypothetical protein